MWPCFAASAAIKLAELGSAERRAGRWRGRGLIFAPSRLSVKYFFAALSAPLREQNQRGRWSVPAPGVMKMAVAVVPGGTSAVCQTPGGLIA